MPTRSTLLALFSVVAAVATVPGAAQVAPHRVWAPPLPALASADTIAVDVNGVDGVVADLVDVGALRVRAETRLRQGGVPVRQSEPPPGAKRALRLQLHAGVRPPLAPNGDLGLVVSVALVRPDGPAVLWRTMEDFQTLTAYRYLRDAVPRLVDAHLDAFVRAYATPRTAR